MTPEQNRTSPEQSHVVRSEEVVCDLASRSLHENDESLREKIDAGTKVDLCKIEGTKATNNTESKEIGEIMVKLKCIVEHEKTENHVDLPVDDKVKNSGPAIQELKLKIFGKQMVRKDREITRLRERLRQVEEEKDDINKNLNEILELNKGEKDRLIIELKQRVKELENEKEQLSTALKEAILVEQQTKEEHKNLKERHCKHSHNPQNASLLDILNETNKGAGWLGKHKITAI